jgi:hypothetical protein
MALNPNELQKVDRKFFTAGWRGSDLEWAQAKANGSMDCDKLLKGGQSMCYLDEEIVTRSFNLAHLQEPVPAAAYFAQGGAMDCDVWNGWEGGCNTITKGRYYPRIQEPEALRLLDPAWEFCTFYGLGAQDPPIELRPVISAFLPTPTLSIQLDAPTADPASKSEINYPSMTPTNSFGAPASQGIAKTSVYSRPGNLQAILTFDGTMYTAKFIPQETPVVLVASKTLKLNGSGQTVGTHLLSLGSEGLAIDLISETLLVSGTRIAFSTIGSATPEPAFGIPQKSGAVRKTILDGFSFSTEEDHSGTQVVGRLNPSRRVSSSQALQQHLTATFWFIGIVFFTF